MQLTEGGLQIRPRDLRENAKWLERGTLRWGKRASVNFRVVEYLEEAEVFLNFTADGVPMEQKIESEFHIQHDGGRRWWFLCPGCRRRMGVLYLPPDRTEFRCRDCYDLRYSSQQRDLDFLLKPMAASAGVPRRIARKYLEEVRGLINK